MSTQFKGSYELQVGDCSSTAASNAHSPARRSAIPSAVLQPHRIREIGAVERRLGSERLAQLECGGYVFADLSTRKHTW